MPPLFNHNRQIDESELVDSLANKAPRRHKAVLISQGFNPETVDIATFVEHRERSKTTDNIATAKFSASYEDSDTTENKKSVPRSSRSMRKTARNVVRKTPRFIILFAVKKIVTPIGSAKYSRQGLQIKTSLNMGGNITR